MYLAKIDQVAFHILFHLIKSSISKFWLNAVIASRSIEFKYNDEKFYFCSVSCEKEFKSDPEKYKDYEHSDPKLMHKQSSEEELVVDPVCKMEVYPSYSIEHEYKGKKYYFCAESCVEDFKLDPDKYLLTDSVKEM